MVLWLPKGHVIMVDLGSTKNKGIVTKDSFKYFKDHTKFKDPGQSLEWLVLTHGDRDHYNMVEEFLKLIEVNVRNVLHGGLESDYGKLIKTLRERTNPDATKANIYTGQNSFFNLLGSTAAFGAEVGALATGVECTSTS